MFSLAIIVTPNSAQKKNAHRIQAIKQQATDQNIDFYTFIYHTTYWIFFLVSSSLSLSLSCSISPPLRPSNNLRRNGKLSGQKTNVLITDEWWIRMKFLQDRRQSITYGVTRHCGNVCAHILSCATRKLADANHADTLNIWIQNLYQHKPRAKFITMQLCAQQSIKMKY